MKVNTGRWFALLAFSTILILVIGNSSSAKSLQDSTTSSASPTWPTCSAHTHGIGSVAFSPDGTAVLAGWEPGQARIWDSVTGQVLQTFALSENAAIYSLAFSLDGKFILIGLGKEAELFDRQTGILLHSYSNNPDANFGGMFTTAVFLPDGKSIITFPNDGGLDGAVLWDITSGTKIRAFAGEMYYTSIGNQLVSHDGKYVITQDLDNWYLWDVESGNKLQTFPSSGYDEAGFSPDGKLLFVDGRPVPGNYDSVSVWQLDPLKQVNAFKNMVWQDPWQVSLDDKYLVWTDHGTSFLVAIATGVQLYTFKYNVDPAPQAFLPDSKHILALIGPLNDTIGAPVTLVIWDIASEQEEQRFTIHQYGNVNIDAISPDGKSWLTGSDFGEIRLWSLENGKVLQQYC